MNTTLRFFLLFLFLASCCYAQVSTGSSGVPTINVEIGQDSIKKATENIPDGGLINLIYNDGDILKEDIRLFHRNITIKGQGKNGPRLFVDPKVGEELGGVFYIVSFGVLRIMDLNIVGYPNHVMLVEPSYLATTTVTGTLEVISCRFANIDQDVIYVIPDVGTSFSNLVVKDCEFIENSGAIVVDSQFQAGVGDDRSIYIATSSFVNHSNTVLGFHGLSRGTGVPQGRGPPSVNIMDCNFTDNQVGAISATNVGRMNIYRSNFLRNRVEEEFSLGGAASVSTCDHLDINETSFEENSAVDGGGALFLSIVRILKIRYTSFTGNSCEGESGLGGGLFWEDHEEGKAVGRIDFRLRWSVDMENCTFVNNKASRGGGLLALGRNENGLVFGGFRVVKSLFQGNEAKEAAGGIGFVSDSALRLGTTTFRENKADRGGGMAMRLSGVTSMDTVHFHNNTAKSAGGGIYALSLRSLRVKDSDFTNGLASEGGAMMLDGVQQTEITGTNFRSNRATLGGGLVHVGRSLILNKLTLVDCAFTANVASTLLDYQNLDGLRGSLKGGGGALALIALENPDKGSIDAHVQKTDFVRNEAYSGGALFVATNKGSAFSELSIKLADCNFDQNAAEEAGGIMLVDKIEGIEVQCGSKGGYKSLNDLFPAFCPNWSTRALPNADGPIDKNSKENSKKLAAKVPFGEVVASALVGRLMASPNKTTGNLSGKPVAEIVVYPFDLFGQMMTSTILGRPVEVQSVTDHPNLTLTGTTVSDAVNGAASFNRLTIIGDPGNYTLNMTGHLVGSLASKRASVQLVAELRECIVGEVAQDNSLFGCLLCSNGLYSFNRKNSTCDACPKYANCSASIGSEGVLERQPVVPLNGYWHSTPFSIQMHLCLSSDACDFEGRIQALQTTEEPGTGQCRPGHLGILCGACEKDYGHSSVGECTRCQATWIYTALISFTMLLSLFLVIATLRGNLLTERRQDVFEAQGFSLHIPLAEISCMNEEPQAEKSQASSRENTKPQAIGGRHSQTVGDQSPGEGSNGNSKVQEGGRETVEEHVNVSGCLDSQPSPEKPDALIEETVQVHVKVSKAPDGCDSQSNAEKSHGSNGNRVYVHVNVSRANKRSNSQSNREKSVLGRNRSSIRAHGDGPTLQERQSVRDNGVSLAATSVMDRATLGENNGEIDDPGLKVAELIKIMINFSQVTGTAFIIDFDWPDSIKQMVGVQDMVSATSAAWTAIECAMPDGSMVTKSMSALLLQMSTPIIMSVLLVCFWFCRAAYIHLKITPLNFKGYLFPRLLVSAWSIVFFFYDSWTESFMKLMYCPSVDDYNESRPYFEFSTATSRVWAQDTAVTCFSGVHQVLFYGIGLPGLIIFSLGVPLAMFVFIVYNRHRLTNPLFRAFYGFMYLNYDIEYAYWESAIMVRKALIVGIAILAHSLGRGLQGVLMFSVVFGAVVAHTITRPLPLDLLDNMETCSLGTTACTFFSAALFSQPNLSRVGRVLLSIFVYGINVVFVLHFTVTFVRAVHEYVISYKEEDEEMTREAPGENVGFSQKVWYLVVTRPWKTVKRYLRKLVPRRAAS
ncbi:hypothetical protein BSKO_12678 [Bryopsis sp. KO-2023]|nr:hypothetical protein BSKO_12678 [Bryopsis sp. KO-2023]